MNYRHGYHAGNFADVVKHALLVRLVEYLKRKDGAFRVIDTHAGAGLYDLSGEEAQKTGEWREGIGRLLALPVAGEAAALLDPYLALVREHFAKGALGAYPGSPLIVRRLMRAQDRLSLFDLHPDAHRQLAKLFAGDFQTRVTMLDGWLVPGAHLPPKEKRGLLFVDPPFEAQGEFARLAAALAKAHRRWPGGMACLWYPAKSTGEARGFLQSLTASDLPDLWNLSFQVAPPGASETLAACGLIVKNPPYVLEAELKIMMPPLAAALGRGSPALWRYERLTGERP
jgi:23S rRNA (adenine2030-N6)-methyltransferase